MDGDWAACFGKIEGTHSGEFMGIKPTGKRVFPMGNRETGTALTRREGAYLGSYSTPFGGLITPREPVKKGSKLVFKP